MIGQGLRSLLVLSAVILVGGGCALTAFVAFEGLAALPPSERSLAGLLAILLPAIGLGTGALFELRHRRGRIDRTTRWLRYPFLLWFGVAAIVGWTGATQLSGVVREGWLHALVLPAEVGLIAVLVARATAWASKMLVDAEGPMLPRLVAGLSTPLVGFAALALTAGVFKWTERRVQPVEVQDPESVAVRPVSPAPLPLVVAAQSTGANVDELRFEECTLKLAQSADGRAATDKAVSYLIRKSRTAYPEDAEDIVFGTLLAVCSHYMYRPFDDLGGYFFRSVLNAANKQWRRQVAVADDDPQYCELQMVDPNPADRAIALDFQRAFCALESADQGLLELSLFRGMDYASMAEAAGVSEAAVRKRLSRARNHLRSAMAQ